MLQTLNNLAGKISPHPVPSNGNVIDGNGNKLGHKNNNNNNHATLNNNFGKSEKSFIHAPYKRITSSEQGSPIDELSHKELDMQDQPDPDYIKMFVGQIPRTMDEEELKAMFSEYGRVHQINVLRDKHTGQSKGCCFLTYYTRKAALDAQNALHNIKILPGMHHPIQMKPADSENRNERKLFVGMLSKKCNETDIRTMFEHFGTIEECTVLRDNQGISKGCAFVTYTSKQCAINAIKTMHQSHTMEGCSSPLVVKFADTQKDKDQKKLQQMQSSIWNMAGINFPAQHYLATAALSQQFAPNANETTQCLTPLQLLQQQLQASAAVTNGHSNMNNSLNGLLLHNSQSSDLHGLSNLNGSCHNISDINPVNLQSLATLANLSVTNAAVNPIHMQNLISLAALTGGNSMSPSGSTANLTNSALSGLANTAAAALLGKKASGLLTSNATPLSALTSNTATLNGFTSNTLSLSELSGSVLGSTNISRDIAINAAGKQIEGPVGANLFIYHLPQDCTDLDLASMFTPFGTLISAKVYIDKDTKRSKCFGFVSYDNVLNAQHAIQNMNGYPIGTKRLKVEPKRRKDSKPY